MASAGYLGDAPTGIDDLDQVQDLRPPPLAHIVDRSVSLCRDPKQGHFAALSENEAQTNDGLLQNYGLHSRSGDISQAYLSEKEAGIECNCCFLCFRKGTEDYTIKVFFAWPSRKVVKVEEKRLKKKKGKRALHKTSKSRSPESPATELRGRTEGGKAVELGGPTRPADTTKRRPKSSFECETSSVDQGSRAEVMQAVQDALYQQQGRWKRWLWGYDIQGAQEIKASHICMFKSRQH